MIILEGHLLSQALLIAIRVHAKQEDKQGEPYLLHILRVVESVKDETKVIAALHDTLEDSKGYWELGELVQALYPAVLSEQELEALELLSRNLYKEETYFDYINTIHNSSNSIAIEVKLADLHDNLNRIPHRDSTTNLREEVEWDAEWRSLKRRYEKAIKILES